MRRIEGQGSVFTVTLPLDSSVYESKDFLISTVLMEETDHTDERHSVPSRKRRTDGNSFKQEKDIDH